MMNRIRTNLLVCALVLATTACQAQPAATDSDVPTQVVRVGEMAGPRAAHQATRLPSGKVLVTGGCAGQCDVTLADVEVFDPATARFESLPGMAMARSSHAAVAMEDGRVLVLGGWNGSEVTASVVLFDEASGRFSAIAEMTQARASPRAVRLADGRVLVTGGFRAEMAPLDSAEIFDPAPVASRPSPRWEARAS